MVTQLLQSEQQLPIDSVIFMVLHFPDLPVGLHLVQHSQHPSIGYLSL